MIFVMIVHHFSLETTHAKTYDNIHTIYISCENYDICNRLRKYIKQREGKKEMNNLENWIEIERGLYKYVISSGYCYEIHLRRHEKNTDILTADAALYIVGDWKGHADSSEYFVRSLLFKGPVKICLEKAVEDEEENEYD